MTKKADLGGSLKRLTQKLVDQALEDGVDLKDRLEVLKTAGAYFLGAEKIKLKTPDDDPEAPSFGKFKDQINGASKGIGHG